MVISFCSKGTVNFPLDDSPKFPAESIVKDWGSQSSVGYN